MVKKRGLGKSLDALLSYASPDQEREAEGNTSSQELFHLPIDQIQRGKYQPRREINSESLNELAESIRSQGIIQPLIVRPIGESKVNRQYEIIAGERRFRAAKIAGLANVPVIIRAIPDEAALAIALIENIQRENLSPIEEAIAIDRLLKEFSMTHQQVAESLGKSRVSVTNLLRLLQLPDEVKDLLERGSLEMGHARALITLPQELQLKAAEMIVVRNLSVRETEQFVRRLQSPLQPNAKKSLAPDLLHIQENLAQQLKLRVALHCNAKGKGKLVIHYRNLSELDNLLTQFQTND